MMMMILMVMMMMRRRIRISNRKIIMSLLLSQFWHFKFSISNPFNIKPPDDLMVINDGSNILIVKVWNVVNA